MVVASPPFPPTATSPTRHSKTSPPTPAPAKRAPPLPINEGAGLSDHSSPLPVATVQTQAPPAARCQSLTQPSLAVDATSSAEGKESEAAE